MVQHHEGAGEHPGFQRAAAQAHMGEARQQPGRIVQRARRVEMGAVEDLVVQAAGQILKEPLLVFPVLEPLQGRGARVEAMPVQGHLRAYEEQGIVAAAPLVGHVGQQGIGQRQELAALARTRGLVMAPAPGAERVLAELHQRGLAQAAHLAHVAPVLDEHDTVAAGTPEGQLLAVMGILMRTDRGHAHARDTRRGDVVGMIQLGKGLGQGADVKLISWNVNGLRACVQKGFLDYFHAADADFFCIQESKLQEGQITLDLPDYHQYWNYAEKKGYSGTAIFAKKEPLNVTRGIGTAIYDTEGRVITLEYDTFYLVTCYTPNSQNELARLSYRMEWEDAFRTYLLQLDRKKPVILCGDLNVAHTEIDLKNPKTNRKNAGFSDEEREKMTELLSAGFTDTFRYFYPDAEGIYSWWSYRFKAREKNAGWRIDYFITSRRLDSSLTGAAIHTDVFGSDHCPVELTIEL